MARRAIIATELTGPGAAAATPPASAAPLVNSCSRRLTARRQIRRSGAVSQRTRTIATGPGAHDATFGENASVTRRICVVTVTDRPRLRSAGALAMKHRLRAQHRLASAGRPSERLSAEAHLA
jgi:hypothetical protein